MGSITINVINNNTNRTAASTDGVSMILSYNSGITGLTYQKYYSIENIENDGYTSTAYPVENFQCKEFFKQNPTGTLYLAIAPTASTYTYAEITTIQRAVGEIKNIAIFSNEDTTSIITSGITNIKTQCETLVSEYIPLYSVYLAVNAGSLTKNQINSLTDITTSGKNNRWLQIILHKNISENPAGAFLGVKSRIGVGSRPSATTNNLMDFTDKYDDPYITTTVKVSDLSVSEMTALSNKGYIYAKKYPGIAGTYVSSSITAVPSTDDYTSIDRTSIVYKAYRGLYQDLFGLIDTDLDTKGGKLTPAACAVIENRGNRTLQTMMDANEISAKSFYLDPNQDVINTDKVEISFMISPTIKATNIYVNLGISTNI